MHRISSFFNIADSSKLYFTVITNIYPVQNLLHRVCCVASMWIGADIIIRSKPAAYEETNVCSQMNN